MLNTGFLKHYEYWSQYASPPFRREDHYEIIVCAGETIARLLAGGSKEDCLAAAVRDDRPDIRNRIFLTENEGDAFECLAYATADRGYSRRVIAHESEHIRVYRNFTPSLRRDRVTLSGVYGIIVYTGGDVNPCAVYARTTWTWSAIEWTRRDFRENRFHLFEDWDVETIREWWRYLRQQTPQKERSRGDQLLLREDK